MSSKQASCELKVDSGCLRVTPVTSYDPFEAKFCASLYWVVLVNTQEGSLDNMPPQVTSPIERDTEHRITVRPEVVDLLTNGEVYSNVCESIFTNKQPVIGHWAVIQCLSRHGFYVVEEGDIPVTDSTLQQKRPFRKSTHLALMDGLMMAYSSKVLTIPQVVKAVRRFAPFNASKELPFDLEDALLLWLNKVCVTLNEKEINKQKLHAENLLRDQDKAKRFRFRRDQLQPKAQTIFPVIDDLLKGVSDGQCLLGTVMFYFADSIKLEDIKFGQDLVQEDMVHNIELFRSLCSQHICTTALSLQVEDFIYSSHAMKPNVMALLAEMFYKCELEEDTLTKDNPIIRSKSVVNMNGPSAIDNINRSSSAPLLASEIIAAHSPAVGRKLKDFTKEKNQSMSTTSHQDDEETLTNDSSEKPLNGERPMDKNNRDYSLQLDFTDDMQANDNPFSKYRKPVLLTRKHSAPEPFNRGPKLEPSLNRRTKQKPRTLALDDWEMDDKDMIDVQVTDLQRSHSLTELDSKEPRKSFHAWQGETSSSETNLDVNIMKSQRISLDFRSNKSFEQDILIRPHRTADKNREDRLSQDSLRSSSPKSVDSLPSRPSSGRKHKDNPVSQSTISEQDLKEFEEMEAVILAQRSSEFHKYIELSDEDVLNASVSSDDMNLFRLEVLQRLSADKVKTMEKQNNYYNNQGLNQLKVGPDEPTKNTTECYQGEAVISDDRPEDLLSPINESSEPLHSTGSLPETRSSTPSTTPSSPISPLDVAPFTPAFFMTSPANTIDKKAYKKASSAKHRHKDTPNDSTSKIEAKQSETPRFEAVDTPRHKSIEILARGSYTMEQISLDAAKAAGIPVIGSESIELRNNPNQIRLSRSTVRSLSVPLDNDPIIQQEHDKASSSSHSHLPFTYEEQQPLNEQIVNSGAHPFVNDIQDNRQFSPAQFEDVVIFDRERAESFNATLPYGRDQSYHEPVLQRSRVNSAERSDSRNRLYHDHVDGSRSPRSQSRDSYVRTSYIPTSTETDRSYSNVRHSLVEGKTLYQDPHVRYNTNTVFDTSSRAYGSVEPGTSQETRPAYSDPYGTYVRSTTPDIGYHGNVETGTSQQTRTVNSDPYGTYVRSTTPDIGYHGNVEPGTSQQTRTVYSDQYGTYVKSTTPEMGYHGYPYNQGQQQGYTSPRHTNPDQYATYHKDPRSNVIYRQSVPEFQLYHQVSTNQNATPHVHPTVSSGLPGNGTNWEYHQSPKDQQTFGRPTSQQYQSPINYSRPNSQPVQHAVSPRYVNTASFDNRYHEQLQPHQGYEGNNSHTNKQSHGKQLSPHQCYEGNISHTNKQSHGNGMLSNQFSPFELPENDDRIPTPERKSQAFTVDLDTGELKEFNSSAESSSPRSPGSAILRSKTFRKGPEERVFEYDAKQQNKARPQTSESNPEVVMRKDKNASHASIINRTSWSESAEALKAVLHNGFPTFNKDSEVGPSPRISSPRKAEKTSPGARITWMTAGRNSLGGQVMLNENGEIDESKSDDVEQDTASPQHRALSLQFEEKRRQIEAEKHRSQEQWDEERRRLDETAFWYTIGRAKSTDKNAGNVRPDHEKIECLSPGQPTPPIGRSTPFECLSPLLPKPGYQSPTVERSQSPGNHVEPSIGHGYHQAALHRPGLGLGLTQTGHQSPVSSQTGFQFPSTNFQTGQPVSQHEGERDIYQQQQEFETRQFLFSEYTSQGNQHQELTPSSPSQITKSPVRKCWEVNPPAATTVFTPPSPEGVALHVEEDEQDDNEDQLQNKKGFSMFIGDEAEKPKEGLTPEQQKKRDRFLKSRQKKQEEEKVRKDVENEKKRLREIKQKELEEQKRIEEDQKRHEHQRRLKRDSMGSSGESSYRPGANQHDDISAFNEFSGPRCYVKPSGKSNRKLIINAISHVCLSGTVNKENKEKCLQAIAESPGCHFIVLFKDGLKFRGLYMLHPETEQGFKIFGIGPKVITSKMVDCVYKYGSGGKEFTKIASKSLSISVDGIAILKSYWQSNKPNVASKTQSNLKRPPRPPQR